MNIQPQQALADLTAESIRQMQEFKAHMQEQMPPEMLNAQLLPFQAILKKIMGIKHLQPIEACELIIDQLDANLALEEDERELQKAIYLMVACDMMGQDFINSLTQ